MHEIYGKEKPKSSGELERKERKCTYGSCLCIVPWNIPLDMGFSGRASRCCSTRFYFCFVLIHVDCERLPAKILLLFLSFLQDQISSPLTLLKHQDHLVSPCQTLIFRLLLIFHPRFAEQGGGDKTRNKTRWNYVCKGIAMNLKATKLICFRKYE